jgi:alcohol dehydrogenase class IV
VPLNFESFYSTATFSRFSWPSTVYWGSKSLERLPTLLKEGSVEVFIDKNLEDACSFFLSQLSNVNVHVLSGMPIYEEVLSYSKKFPEMPVNVVAIGGGSVIDFAKGVIASRMFGEIQGLGIGSKSGMQNPVCDLTFFVSVPTTMGAGAECSRYFVLYRKSDKAKVHGKSWSLISNVVLIDPDLLEQIPLEIAISTAFDAFIHYWESSISKGEASLLIKNAALVGMSTIFNNVAKLLNGFRDDETLLNLSLMSTVAGTMISNSRTGNIHEAAGILLESTDLSHGETLFVFARTAYSQYKKEVEPLFDVVAKLSSLESFEEVLLVWEDIFKRVGLSDRINVQLESLLDKNLVDQKIQLHLEKDRVWNLKESPFPVTEESIKNLAAAIYLRF